MRTIDFSDKSNSLPTTDPRRLGRATDFNEIKTVVNENALLSGYKAIAWLPPAAPEDAAFPEGVGTGSGGIVMDGNRFRLSAAGYLPTGEGGAAELWPKGTIVESFEDTPGQDPEKWRAY